MKKKLTIILLTTLLLSPSFANDQEADSVSFFPISSSVSDEKQFSLETTQEANNEKVHQYVKGNMEVLALDMSRGEGESLETLALLLNVVDRIAFIANLQKNFDKIYLTSDSTSQQIVARILIYVV